MLMRFKTKFKVKISEHNIINHMFKVFCRETVYHSAGAWEIYESMFISDFRVESLEIDHIRNTQLE